MEEALCKSLSLLLLLLEEGENKEKEFGFGHFKFERPFLYPDGICEVRNQKQFSVIKELSETVICYGTGQNTST